MLSESLSSFVIFGCRSLHNRDKRADWEPARLAPGVICGRGKCRVCLRDSVCNAAASSIPEHIGFLVYFHLIIPFYLPLLSLLSVSPLFLYHLSFIFISFIYYHIMCQCHFIYSWFTAIWINRIPITISIITQYQYHKNYFPRRYRYHHITVVLDVAFATLILFLSCAL